MSRTLLLMLSLMLLLPHTALAQAYPASKPAFVVLRFNQPRVYYEQPLYDAVAKAVSLKPDVMFDVVSYAPATGDARMDAAWESTAGHNTQSVVASMQRIGVPLSRINVTGQHINGLNYDEVHLFVR
jgi:hypothetical protein